ncbi:MAG: glycoside hydrolase family 3 C-terminal domain-containing protein [Clostridia bacterium]|nr:glycoside hydrolase family 3 C-terminal domain-containing protein [Clostridia bacterium]
MKDYDLLNRMTIREKLLLLGGGSFFSTKSFIKYGINSLEFSDGPNGLRRNGNHICYPSSAAMASSWNLDIIKDEAVSIASECAHDRVSLLLAPGINIKRHPYCGRNFEYYSEDPYLTAQMATTFVKALQKEGIGACIKHYLGNNCETNRMTSNSVIDKRALREIYTYAFENVVKNAKPWAVMTSYNRVNGEYPSESPEFLYNLLRKTFGHKNLIVTDWSATSNRTAQIKATNDLEMPSPGYYRVSEVIKDYHSGKITEEQINKSCKRLIKLIDKSEIQLMKPKTEVNLDSLHEKTVEYATQTAILLKNENKVFPIDLNDKIAIIGEYAEKPILSGMGSAYVKPYKSKNFLNLMKTNGYNFEYSKGYDLFDLEQQKAYLQNEAIATAREADKVILFAGSLPSEYSEAMDRQTLDLPINQLKLIDEIIKLKKQVAVVTCSSSVIKLPFKDSIQTIMHTYPMGEGGPEALFNLITGKTSPSGKLAETFIESEKDLPTKNLFGDRNENVVYDESIFVGYRYYDIANKTVNYPFGHGLSYADFEYSDIKIDKKLNVTFNIKNISDTKAFETAQVYISFVGDSKIYRPTKVLKGFQKVELEAGQTKSVTIKLFHDSFEYFSLSENKFIIEKGHYKILVGSSSKDIRLEKKIFLNAKSETISDKNYREKTPSYYMGRPDLAADCEKNIIFDNKLNLYKTEKSFEYDEFTKLNDGYKFPAISRKIERFTNRLTPKCSMFVKMGADTVGNFPLSRLPALYKGMLNKDAVKDIYYIVTKGKSKERIKDLSTNIIKSLPTAFMTYFYKDHK